MTISPKVGPISPLRRRMLEDMKMRGLGSHTQIDYVRHVYRFASFLGRPPDTATVDDLRRYQLYQHESGVGPSMINSFSGSAADRAAEVNRAGTEDEPVDQSEAGVPSPWPRSSLLSNRLMIGVGWYDILINW